MDAYIDPVIGKLNSFRILGAALVGDKEVAKSIDGTDPNSLKSLTLTRVGDFQFKADGYLCDGNGNPVYADIR